MANTHRVPKVAFVGTGGTIDTLGASSTDLVAYIETKQRMEPDEMWKLVPEVGHVATITTIPYRRMASHHMASSDWLHLSRTVRDLAEGDFDGIVIGHGTNTIEETGFFLRLTVPKRIPIVLVGAMRPISAVSSDAPFNLMNAVRVAASGQDLGVVIAMDGRILVPGDATKSHTFRLDAVSAGESGPIGYIDPDGNVRIVRQPSPYGREEFSLSKLNALPRTDVVLSYVDSDAVLVDAAVEAGAKGIVLAGTGAGWPTPGEHESLRKHADNGVIVCLASRVGSGPVVLSPRLKAQRFVSAHDLRPWNARVLLSLALTITQEPLEMRELFRAYRPGFSESEEPR